VVVVVVVVEIQVSLTDLLVAPVLSSSKYLLRTSHHFLVA
jgi:hypothetical protein